MGPAYDLAWFPKTENREQKFSTSINRFQRLEGSKMVKWLWYMVAWGEKFDFFTEVRADEIYQSVSRKTKCCEVNAFSPGWKIKHLNLVYRTEELPFVKDHLKMRLLWALKIAGPRKTAEICLQYIPVKCQPQSAVDLVLIGYSPFWIKFIKHAKITNVKKRLENRS